MHSCLSWRALSLACGFGLTSTALSQLRMATWNITNYSSGRTSAFQTALFSSFEGRSFNPDVLVVQELQGTTGVNNFLNLLNSAPGQSGQWAVGTPYLSTGDTDSAMFYRKSKVDFIGLSNITGDPRDTQRYDFRLKGYDASSTVNPEISYYSSHLKAGSTSDDKARRLTETTNIRNDAASLPAGRNFMIGGDFNIQSSAETSYQKLIDTSVSNGRFYDPINTSYTSGGSTITWNNNSAYRFVHTQDPYGAGGLDDRFDFILTGNSLRDGKGLEYIGSTTQAYSNTTWNDPNHSYRVWGNDGTSFNSTLTTTGNTMVGSTIAQALIDSVGNSNPNNTGGHLPVFLDLKVPADLAANKTAIDFGTQMINTSIFETVTVSNAVDAAIWGSVGVQDLTYSCSITGSGFFAPGGTFTLGAGESFTNHFQLDTSTTGSKSALLTITDTATGQQRFVNLSGVVMVPEPSSVAALGLGLVVLLRRRKKK
ncbi:MAG: PEP-CTERM sorting domain-containing protein [Armatimonadetes bacterium]|nr:PEP-CTERM sorting domain-containing protein [Armatimonadota bacterium]